MGLRTGRALGWNLSQRAPSVDRSCAGEYPDCVLSWLRMAAMVSMTLVLGWHGAGAPLERPDQCECEEGEAWASPDEAASHEGGGEHAHETCPPGCEDCPCCGGVSMVAAVSSRGVDVVSVRSLVLSPPPERAAPRGEPSSLFRPPRA